MNVDAHTIHNHQLVRWGGRWLAFNDFDSLPVPRISLLLQQGTLCRLAWFEILESNTRVVYSWIWNIKEPYSLHSQEFQVSSDQ
jgi:hypothetical protein